MQKGKTALSPSAEKVLVVSLFRLLLKGRCLLNCAEVAVVQWRFAQQSDKDQRAHAAPGDQQESIDDAQAVGLKARAGCNQIDRACAGSDQARRLGLETCGHPMNVLICYPVPTTEVQSQQVRVQFFPLCQEMAHVNGAC